MAALALVTPPDDRTAARVIFPMTGQDLRQAMRRACQSAGHPALLAPRPAPPGA